MKLVEKKCAFKYLNNQIEIEIFIFTTNDNVDNVCIHNKNKISPVFIEQVIWRPAEVNLSDVYFCTGHVFSQFHVDDDDVVGLVLTLSGVKPSSYLCPSPFSLCKRVIS